MTSELQMTTQNRKQLNVYQAFRMLDDDEYFFDGSDDELGEVLDSDNENDSDHDDSSSTPLPAAIPIIHQSRMECVFLLLHARIERFSVETSLEVTDTSLVNLEAILAPSDVQKMSPSLHLL